MSLKGCKKGNHETDIPIFVDEVLGGVIGWRCECGEKTSPPIILPPEIAANDPFWLDDYGHNVNGN